MKPWRRAYNALLRQAHLDARWTYVKTSEIPARHLVTALIRPDGPITDRWIVVTTNVTNETVSVLVIVIVHLVISRPGPIPVRLLLTVDGNPCARTLLPEQLVPSPAAHQTATHRSWTLGTIVRVQTDGHRYHSKPARVTFANTSAGGLNVLRI